MTFPPLPFCHCLWNDAHSPQATYVIDISEDISSIHGSMPILTSGWVLKQDEKGISIASEYCGGTSYRGATHIPASMIVEVVIVKPPRAKKKRPPKEPPVTSES